MYKILMRFTYKIYESQMFLFIDFSFYAIISWNSVSKKILIYSKSVY